MKDLLKISYLTLSFTVVIFFINYNFFWNLENITKNTAVEEKYIDNEIKDNKNYNTTNKKELIDYYKEKNNNKYDFYYYPKNFEIEIINLKNDLETILLQNIFLGKIDSIDISLIKEKTDRRWKMKNKEIKLFWAKNNLESEYLSVFIHEFWHYIDLYFLEKKVFLDISSKFYEISWIETKIKKNNLSNKDFVSWYSMTNKYEDFAESFTYYILHNKEFLEKTKTSFILKQKYEFFSIYIFKNKEFFNSDFRVNDKKNYYRDITKIEFDKNKLFNYLKKIAKEL